MTLLPYCYSNLVLVSSISLMSLFDVNEGALCLNAWKQQYLKIIAVFQ